MIGIISFLGFTSMVAVIAWWSTRKTDENSSDGYFLAGRSLTAGVIAGSLLLTNLSTEQIVKQAYPRCREGSCPEIDAVIRQMKAFLSGKDIRFSLDLIRLVSENSNIPVIASGGAGNYEDMFQALTTGKATAVAAASIFHFTEQTPLEAKKYLRDKGIPTRK